VSAIAARTARAVQPSSASCGVPDFYRATDLVITSPMRRRSVRIERRPIARLLPRRITAANGSIPLRQPLRFLSMTVLRYPLGGECVALFGAVIDGDQAPQDRWSTDHT
jgi:hypothetical protein